ncbi:hypothetical protein OsI_12315 [Oryza sativa Indica Group]|uniref:Transposase-associated domain-containing protein n=1 Tax=Oryza sativa subsp. indica TaxID=39946 RepID=B8AL73_ORYSI|nr:hypothetical protein OsI_12315 [Oryza sativa Indica Group]
MPEMCAGGIQARCLARGATSVGEDEGSLGKTRVQSTHERATTMEGCEDGVTAAAAATEYFFWSAYRDKFWQGSMSVDRSWMRMSRATAEWQKGLQEFLNFAFQDDNPGDNAPCPCRRCLNVVHKTRSEVQSDLLRNGFDESYIQWVYHGEDSDDDNVTEGVGADDVTNDGAAVRNMINSLLRGTNPEATSSTHEDNYADNSGTFTEDGNVTATEAEDMDQSHKKGRGTHKGFKVAKKRFSSGSQKLQIEFSTRLGGPIGINHRSFVEEVVMYTKKKAPLIGVRTWKDIHETVKKSIVIDVLRDKETGEEPSILDLWQATHMRNGEWSNIASKDVYENAHNEISEREADTGNAITNEEQNIVFQACYRDSTGCKTSQARGQGYMAKPLTTTAMLHAKLDEQAHVTSETQQQNDKLSSEVEELKAKLAAREEESDKALQAERNERLRFEQEERNARLKMQEEERKEREMLREDILKMITTQSVASEQQSDLTIDCPTENREPHDTTKKARSIQNNTVVKALFNNANLQGTTSTTRQNISSQHLRNVARNFVRSRTDQARGEKWKNE